MPQRALVESDQQQGRRENAEEPGVEQEEQAVRDQVELEPEILAHEIDESRRAEQGLARITEYEP